MKTVKILDQINDDSKPEGMHTKLNKDNTVRGGPMTFDDTLKEKHLYHSIEAQSESRREGPHTKKP